MALNWEEIKSTSVLEDRFNEVSDRPKLFFKHSTRCSISSMSLRMFERAWDTSLEVDLYFIDLIAHRDVSNLLAELSGVQHQSPQAIVIRNNEVVYHDSHGTIDADKIKSLLN